MELFLRRIIITENRSRWDRDERLRGMEFLHLGMLVLLDTVRLHLDMVRRLQGTVRLGMVRLRLDMEGCRRLG